MRVKPLSSLWPAIAVTAGLVLTACGGGSGPSDTPAGSSSTSISGVAGTGAPMSGATVTVTCASGSATATAGADGAFTATFTSAPTAPCAIKAVGVDGTGEQIVQYSVLDTVTPSGNNTANVNPATTVVAGAVLSGDPEAFFEDAAANLGQITPEKVQTAIQQIQVVVGDIDPIKGEYVADKVNALDQKFDQLKIEWNPSNSTFTVTSKVTGAVVGSASTENFDGSTLTTRLNDTSVVPASGPSFAALDTQLGAAINAALSGSSPSALAAVFDPHFKDGGMDAASTVSMVWSEDHGGTVGKFTVVGCKQLPSNDTVGLAYQGKYVCRVGATMNKDGFSDPFEVRVIEKTSGQWLLFGDQMDYRVEVRPTMERAIRFDGSTLNTGYRTGLQVWVPLPVDGENDPEALPNANVYRVEVKLGDNLLASLSRCGNADYLQKPSSPSHCAGNLYDMPDENITMLQQAYANNQVMPMLTIIVYDGSDQVLGTYTHRLSTLPVTLAQIEATDSPYQKRFATLNQASVTALQSLGVNAGTFNLNWTTGSRVDDVSWFASSYGLEPIQGQQEDPSGSGVSFTAESLGEMVNYASVYISASGNDGRNYWTKYFGCGGMTCF
ncbi:MAG: hypothetical protein QM742_04185 [Aquabacterium sp.]